MRFLLLLAIFATTLILRRVEAAPFDIATTDLAAGPGLDLRRQQNCQPDVLSSYTWVAQNVDGFLANASQHYTQYPYDNVQSLAAYLGAPNFFCGVNNRCNAGQPCFPVGFPGWYVLMGIQGWNDYVNNLDAAVTYTASILGLKLQNVVDDLWPQKEDKHTSARTLIGWIDGILNAFPATSLIEQVNTQGFGIIAGGMLSPPSTDDLYLRWSQIANQVGSVVEGYKTAIGAYARKVIDAPIADPQWGINRVLRGGAFLYRSTNFTQDDFDAWMYQSVEINAIGTILQAQNVYIIRTFNRTDCAETSDAVLCEKQPNGAWTEWRLHKKDSDDWPPESDLSTKLIQSYGFTKQTLFKGPSGCFDSNDYVQLTNPWDSAAGKGISLDPWMVCNFNINVCNFDAAEDNKGIGDVERYIPQHTDRMCGRQGINWS